MVESFNTVAKSLIRNEWGKPLLKFISKRLKKKLIYLGLPSPVAEDIEDWIEFIDEVIAFQCREYGKPSDVSQSREEIEKLEAKLNKFERQGLLETFTVYDGYIEEVVLKGVDNISKKFSQSNTIRIYNLDFCNKITSPIEYVDIKGDIKSVYKFNAVKKLLRIQAELEEDQQEFILFLTIHSSFDDAEIQAFTNNLEYKELLEKYNAKKRDKKKEWILRLFVIDTLQSYFRENNFVPHFLPTILYKGLKGAQLLHFSILGTKVKLGAGRADWKQSVKNLCCEKLITTNEDTFELINEDALDETDINNLNSVDLFSNSKTYQKVWKN